MTNAVFITGDRSANGFDGGNVVVELLKAVAAQRPVQTGDNPGVEAAVRELANLAGLEVLVVESPRTDEGFVDWDTRFKNLDEDTEVVLVHSQPTSSRIVASAFNTLGDERTRVVSPGL